MQDIATAMFLSISFFSTNIKAFEMLQRTTQDVGVNRNSVTKAEKEAGKML